jgi:hypothetical protein
MADTAPQLAYDCQDRGHKAAAVTTLLEQTLGLCPICWFSGKIACHQYFSCALFREHKKTYGEFRSGLGLLESEVCYYCLVPQREPFNHTLPRSGEKANPRDCHFPDFLKPLLFMIMHDHSTKEGLLELLRVPRSARTKDYLNRWIQDPSTPPSLPKVVELVAIYLQLRHQMNIGL